MPNHFHYLLQQKVDGGITEFVSKISNSYTKYFNTKNERVGPILQGEFKSVLVETDEQLIHLSRYIHLNPLVSYLTDNLESYPWSSHPEYVGINRTSFCSKDIILKQFKSSEDYKQFVLDQEDYGRKLERIKHQTLDLPIKSAGANVIHPKGGLALHLRILGSFGVGVGLAAVQLLPSAELYFSSARSQIVLRQTLFDFLLPIESLLTYLAPDFFGHPATGNFFRPGVAQYYEGILFVGVAALIFAAYAILNQKQDKLVGFLAIFGLVAASTTFDFPTSFFKQKTAYEMDG